ncbi:MAG: C40 family peptidase, partial [Parasporobacterium sp.]|nr:C40 family peptidase [Parasporobacterium sp.]
NGLYTKDTGLTQRADGSSKTWYYVRNGAYTKATCYAQKLDTDDTSFYTVEDGICTGIVLGEKTVFVYGSELPGSLFTGLTGTQMKILKAIEDTPTTEQGYCAGWVTNVFNNAGFWGSVIGNACDMWEWYCDSDDYSDLQPGMIIAVKQSPTYLGQIYGHVGIYLGNGMMADSTGVISIQTVSSWIDSWDYAGTAAWGYPDEIKALVAKGN